jgi:hypothetical protein
LVLIFVGYWLDFNYKSFVWYKSGKLGFAGISLLIILFLVRTLVAIIGIDMVSFVGRAEIIVSGITSLICIGLLINLGKVKV